MPEASCPGMVHPIYLLAVYYEPGNEEWVHHSPTGARESEHTSFSWSGIFELTGLAARAPLVATGERFKNS